MNPKKTSEKDRCVSLMFVLIVVSAGLMLGRIAAVDNLSDRMVQRDRMAQIPKKLEAKRTELQRRGLSGEQISRELKKTAQALAQEARKERPTLSANDRSRWLTIRALVEPESRVYRYVCLEPAALLPDKKSAGQNNEKTVTQNNTKAATISADNSAASQPATAPSPNDSIAQTSLPKTTAGTPSQKASEPLRNCACPCSQQFEKNQQKGGSYFQQWVPYAVDKAMETPGWDSIDLVKHDSPRYLNFSVPWKSVKGASTDSAADSAADAATYDPADPLSGYLYSSKPTLLPTIMAVPYWILYHTMGISLKDRPFLATRILLILINWLPLVFSWILLSRLIDRIAQREWTKIFAMAVVCFATFLSTFVVTLNNHLPCFVCVVTAMAACYEILIEKRLGWRFFAMAGLFGAFAVACELPALAIAGLMAGTLLWKHPKKTAFVALPFGLIVVIGFFATNYIAHGTFMPAYAQKRDHMALAQYSSQERSASLNRSSQSSLQQRNDETNRGLANNESADESVNSESTRNELTINDAAISNAATNEIGTTASHRSKNPSEKRSEALVTSFDPDDWYVYRYIPCGKSRLVQNGRLSHWANRTGIDRGEPSYWAYALHTTLGHHGLFSLSPVWILSFCGLFFWLVQRQTIQLDYLAPAGSAHKRIKVDLDSFDVQVESTGNAGQTKKISLRFFAWSVLLLSLLFFLFYMTRDQGDRNYGGMTCGLRWFFPLIPFWILALLPALDKMASNRIMRSIAYLLLFGSAMSVAYPLWNPWSHPWLYQLMVDQQWITPF